jgi:hypothetical protein
MMRRLAILIIACWPLSAQTITINSDGSVTAAATGGLVCTLTAAMGATCLPLRANGIPFATLAPATANGQDTSGYAVFNGNAANYSFSMVNGVVSWFASVRPNGGASVTIRQSGVFNPPAVCVTTAVPYSVFAAVWPTAAVPIASVPAGWAPGAISLEETAVFASSSSRITALTASIGTLQTPAWYLGPMALMQPSIIMDTEPSDSAAQATAHTLYLSVAVANVNPGNLSALTAGELTATICGTPAVVAVPPVAMLGTLDAASVCQEQPGPTFHQPLPHCETCGADSPAFNCIVQ